MTLPPVKRQPLRENLGGGESPLDVAMRRDQDAKQARNRNRGTLIEAVLAEGTALAQPAVINRSEMAKPLSTPLEQPSPGTVTQVSPQQQQQQFQPPQSTAPPVVPTGSAAAEIQALRAQRRWTFAVGRLLSGLTQTRVWRWMMEALWEGEPVVDYVETKAGSWEVVELHLHDPSGSRLIGTVQKSGIDSTAVIGGQGLLQGGPQEGEHYSFVGNRCRLTARVIGKVSPEVKERLQGLCLHLDELLEDTCFDPQERDRLLPLRMKDGLMSDGPLTSRYAGLRVTAAFVAVVLTLLYGVVWLGNQEYRWQLYLQALGNEPGVHITHFERGWGRTRVEGIRSPESRDPLALARSLGINTATLELKFKSVTLPAGSLIRQAEVKPSQESLTAPVPLPGATAKP